MAATNVEDGDGAGADVDVEVAGQKVHVKNVKSLNTLATLATLVLVCVMGYAFYVHAGETKDASKELVGALKEMTQAMREQNCLARTKGADPNMCRDISR